MPRQVKREEEEPKKRKRRRKGARGGLLVGFEHETKGVESRRDGDGSLPENAALLLSPYSLFCCP